MHLAVWFLSIIHKYSEISSVTQDTIINMFSWSANSHYHHSHDFSDQKWPRDYMSVVSSCSPGRQAPSSGRLTARRFALPWSRKRVKTFSRHQSSASLVPEYASAVKKWLNVRWNLSAVRILCNSWRRLLDGYLESRMNLRPGQSKSAKYSSWIP